MAVGDKLVTLDGLKAVYQELNGNTDDLKNAVSAFDSANQITTVTWARGSLNSTTGEASTSLSARRCRSAAIMLDRQTVATDMQSQFVVYFYNGGTSSSNFLGKTDYMTSCNVKDAALSSQSTATADRFRLLGAMIDNTTNIGDGSSDDVTGCTDHIFVMNKYMTSDDVDTKVSTASSLIEQNFAALANSYVQAIVAAADNRFDLDTLTTPGNYKISDTETAGYVDHIPLTSSGGRLFVFNTIANRLCQLYITSAKKINMFIRYRDASSWGDWRRVAYQQETDEAFEFVRKTIIEGSNRMNLLFSSGGLDDDGQANTNNTRIRTKTAEYTTPVTEPGDYIWIDPEYEARIAFYETRSYVRGTFCKWLYDGYRSGLIEIPKTEDERDGDTVTSYGNMGHYIAILIRKVGATSSDISADLPLMADKVRYIRPRTSRGYTDGERPVYVSIGASSTAGAVHYRHEPTSESDSDAYKHKIRYSPNVFPYYISSVLGLEAYNLAIGGTGFMAKNKQKDTPNFMEVIYNNDALLARAKLITIMFGYGNDHHPLETSRVFPIGNYDDYYPYDEKGYRPQDPTDEEINDSENPYVYAERTWKQDIEYMLDKGATLMGCLNWCIKWINEHYPYAQLILLPGESPSVNMDREITMSSQTPSAGVAPYKLSFRDPYEGFSDDVAESAVISSGNYTDEYGAWRICNEIKKLQKALGVKIVNGYDEGGAISWYSTQAKAPGSNNTRYALFSTVGVASANDFSTSTKYEPYDYVYHTENDERKLYYFITEHTPGVWNSEEVELADLHTPPLPGWNNHPSDEGYLYAARFMAGQIASMFRH